MKRDTKRPTFGGGDALKDKKSRQQSAQRADGFPNGLVEIPGPLDETLVREITLLARNLESREKAKGGKILGIAPFEKGIAIETEGEKLAQHIADAVAKSRKAAVERVFDDEGKRRILTCRLPEKKARKK